MYLGTQQYNNDGDINRNDGVIIYIKTRCNVLYSSQAVFI